MTTTQEQLPPTTQDTAAEQFQYEIMTPHPDNTKVRTTEELHEKYIHLVANLVEQTMGDPEKRPDTMVFLDKSARPVAWMMREFWSEIAPQEADPKTGEVTTIPMPDMKFVNIDRLFWRNTPDTPIAEGGMRPVADEDIDGLRAVFQVGKHNALDNKQRILLIDEQSESGDTLYAARELFSKAYPDLEVETIALIQHVQKVGPKTGEPAGYRVLERPPWYPRKDSQLLSDDETGRGVFSPIPYDRRSKAFQQRFPESSNQFLSSPPKGYRAETTPALAKLQAEYDKATTDEELARISEAIERERLVHVDPKSVQLRKEVGQMALDFAAGKIFPSITTERETIQGMPATVYYELARQEKAARKE